MSARHTNCSRLWPGLLRLLGTTRRAKSVDGHAALRCMIFAMHRCAGGSVCRRLSSIAIIVTQSGPWPRTADIVGLFCIFLRADGASNGAAVRH